jgi:cell division protein FtsI/penicillin-binding protein 2
MTQVLENSLNVGAIKAEQLEGPAAFYQYLQKFGIGTPTGIDVAAETSAPLADLAKWKASQLATASFGQGVDATPIEMLAAVNAVATGGNYVWPHVVDALIDGNGVRHPVQPRVVRQVISAKAAQQMQQMMVGVVEHGSGFAAKIDGFKNHIAGKTGTASIPENGTYLKDQTIGSFVGFVPVEHPQFIMMVITRKPQVLYEGAYVAAPIWKSVASALITQWQIAP